MSLDVYLTGKKGRRVTGTGIYVREDGSNRELTVDEARERYPELVIEPVLQETEELFSKNITHNLRRMAEAAGIYREMWRPDEIGLTKAEQLIEPLQRGLDKLTGNHWVYVTYNPDNGWGTYDGLVEFVRAYLDACRKYPDAEVHVSR